MIRGIFFILVLAPKPKGMKRFVFIFLFILIATVLLSSRTTESLPVSKLNAKDTAVEAIFEELKNKTEALFDAKKDSFGYEGNNSVAGRNGYIYSIVRTGFLFNPYDRYALLAYSIDAKTLYVEVRQLIGKVWVKRFRNTSGTELLGKDAEPVVLEDLNGDGIPEIFIAKEMSPVTHAVRGDAWAWAKEGIQKWNGFEQIVNPEYDTKRHELVGHEIAGKGSKMSFTSYTLNKKGIIEVLSPTLCNCTIANGDSCIVTIDKERPKRVLRTELYKYVPAYFSKEVKALVFVSGK